MKWVIVVSKISGLCLVLGTLAIGCLLGLAVLKMDRSGTPTASDVLPHEPLTYNVVLIILDTSRADRIGARRSGIPVMPNLERFAADS